MPPKVMPGIAKVCANISILLTKELKELVKLADIQHFQRAPPPAKHSLSSKEHEAQPQGIDMNGEKERCIVSGVHRYRAAQRDVGDVGMRRLRFICLVLKRRGRYTTKSVSSDAFAGIAKW